MTSTMGALFSFPGLDHEKRIRGAWDRLVRSGTLTPNVVRTLVEDSWRRCHRAGVDPNRALPRPAGRSFVRPQRERELAQASVPMMKQAEAVLAESGAIMVLANESGVVLETRGDRTTLEEAAHIRLVEGADWSELSRGTNGIGTALSVGGPVHIHAVEHYCVGVRPWTCSATVIRDPTEGMVLGALSVSGLGTTSHQHLLALAVTAAGRIEAALAARELGRRQRLLEYALARLPKSGSGGLMVFDRRGVLIKADADATLTLAAIGVEPDDEPRLRIDALDTGRSEPAGELKLPDWLSADQIEPVIDGGERVGSVVILERHSAALPEGALPAYKLRRAMAFIEAHIDQPIRLEQLAAAAAVSPFHFHRQFKRSTGITPHRYIVQMRMERAKALLSQSELSLAEVAARVGFADQSHFTSIFRRMTSMTPRSYRNARAT